MKFDETIKSLNEGFKFNTMAYRIDNYPPGAMKDNYPPPGLIRDIEKTTDKLDQLKKDLSEWRENAENHRAALWVKYYDENNNWPKNEPEYERKLRARASKDIVK